MASRPRAIGLAIFVAALLSFPRGSSAEIPVVTHGDRFDVSQHLVPGKAVMFDFYADWCGPCRSIAPEIERIALQESARLEVRKVDIVRWGSPVAEQYRIQGIPHVKVFGPDGSLLAEGHPGMILPGLDQLLAKIPASGGRGAALPVVSNSRPAVPFGVFVVVLVAVSGGVLALSGVGRKGSPGVAAPVPAVPERSSAARDAKLSRTPETFEDREWFVKLGESIAGPYSERELRNLRATGLVSSRTPVKRKGDPDFRSLGERRQ